MNRITELRAEGLTAPAIAKRLNAEGHVTARNRPWDERAVYNWENRKSIQKCGQARAVPVTQKPKVEFCPVLVSCKVEGGFAIGTKCAKGYFTPRDDIRYPSKAAAEREISLHAWSKKPGFRDPYGVGR
jgi:Recombinase